MSKLQEIWVIAESEAAAIELTAGAKSLGDNVVLVLSGRADVVSSAATVYYFETGNESFINFIPSIADLVDSRKPGLVIVESTKNGRLVASALAARVASGVLTDSSEIWVEDGAVYAKRMVYGGAAFKIEKSAGIAIVCLGQGVFEPLSGAIAGETIEISPVASGIHFVERRPKKEQTVNLAAAKSVIGVGRGIGNTENLEHARELAVLMKAEVGCTRPISEEEKWMPKSAYIGVSGVMLKPEMYLGLGTSGQIQHMVGVNQATVIFAIDKDKNAPIFKQCDYGLVADLNDAIPALIKKFQS